MTNQVPILSTFLYACESWTLRAELERWIQALEMRCYRRLLNISYKDHVTNEEVSRQNPEWNWSAWWSPNHGKETETQMVWPHLKILGHGKDNSAGEQEGEEDRRRDGKITSRNGREWGLEIPWGQRKTGKGGKVLLQCHLWCPDDLQG